MTAICAGECDPLQISAFLVLLRAKGENSVELSSLVRVMRSHALPVASPGGRPLLDIVGTGGDGHDTVNISTAAAVVCAACGVSVGKHGNRSVSSKSGSADVLEELGVVMLAPEHIGRCIEEAGVAFMFAPKFHPAMKHVVPVRKALKVRTVFNILSPLINPANAQRLCLGVYHPDLLDLYGEVLVALDVEKALVVHCCGLDELAPIGVAEAIEVTRGEGMVRRKIDCTAMGLKKCEILDLKGGDCKRNAEILRDVFAGGQMDSAITETIALNAGAGLYVYGSADR